MNDGGPAFPVKNHHLKKGAIGCSDDWVDEPGMSLRDYFAGRAMEGIMANEEYIDDLFSEISKWSYEMADAMLKERAR